MQDSVSLKHVIEWLDSGEPFSIAFVTANTVKQTGGEWIELKKAWKQQTLSNRELRAVKAAGSATIKFKKNPNHYANSTRNLRLPNAELRKVHLRLIVIFNGKIVL